MAIAIAEVAASGATAASETDDALDARDDALHTINHGDQARRKFVDLVDRVVEPFQRGVEVACRVVEVDQVSLNPSKMASTCSTVTSALSAACASLRIRSVPVRAPALPPPLSAMTAVMTTRLEPSERTARLTQM